MKRKLILGALLAVLACLAAPRPAAAQTYTVVSGTITDPNGQPYAGGTLQIGISASATPTLTPCTTAATCPVMLPGQVTLSPTGSFTMGLYANASILPASSTYTFLVSFPGIAPPLGTGPQTFTVTGVTIAGASQSVSTTLSAAAPAIVSNNLAGSPQKSAATNFGVALTAQTVVPAGSNSAPSNVYTVNFYQYQSLLGASCTAVANTVTPTLAWTGPGGNAQTLALTALSETGNGAVDTFQQQGVTIATSPGTAVTYTTASSLSSTGCSPIPQYIVSVRAIP